jgi:hypothetical protein
MGVRWHYASHSARNTSFVIATQALKGVQDMPPISSVRLDTKNQPSLARIAALAAIVT